MGVELSILLKPKHFEVILESRRKWDVVCKAILNIMKREEDEDREYRE